MKSVITAPYRVIINIIIITTLLLPSCEKEEYGNLIFSSDNDINNIYWSETTDEILYCIYSDYYSTRNPLYAADINTGNTRKIADIPGYYGNPIYQKDNLIYFFNDDMNMYDDYIDLYAVGISGTVPELVRDSLVSPLFSRKYIAYIRYFYTDTSSSYNTVLYDLETGSETEIETEGNNSPFSISPDGDWLLITSSDIFNSRLSLYCTYTGEFTSLLLSSLSDIYGFYWIDNDPYTIQWNYTTCNIKNMRTGSILVSSQDLNNECYFALSPSGQYVYYLEEEIPALASSIVGSHYFLNLISTGTKVRTVIDLERDKVYLEGITFSPEGNRIAYIRDFNQIYIIDL